MQKASLVSLPDVLDAKDIAGFLGIGYVKALKLIRYGGMRYIQIGRVYRVSKANFTDWLNCEQSMIINLD
ncbi:MAG: helix-turn-helix domain-containing protein [Defluviitaleaceae bacterium]|nr:helix-turn-helix domain-containing protein [Defluviitaleaceae bacterium]